MRLRLVMQWSVMDLRRDLVLLVVLRLWLLQNGLVSALTRRQR